MLFVDADRAGPEPCWVRRLLPAASSLTFTTHSVPAPIVLALARDLFGAQPEGWIMGIRGYDFDDFGEGLSERARANLDVAVEWVREVLETGEFVEME